MRGLPMTTRLFIAALALLGIYAGFRWAAGHGMPTESAPLEMKTEDFPLTLGDWKGEEIALDPDLFDLHRRQDGHQSRLP